ncbi:hypothetical protein [Paraliobacillus sediminis]|uniref:hypothetical protein n=1 Tax=Paraliobacillus sediminis TaxID=1885916 RepID=UPI0013C2EE6D|nr:hypothetical protein [Paraliobacillus sediminis]
MRLPSGSALLAVHAGQGMLRQRHNPRENGFLIFEESRNDFMILVDLVQHKHQ